MTTLNKIENSFHAAHIDRETALYALAVAVAIALAILAAPSLA